MIIIKIVESLSQGIDFISTNYPFQLSSSGKALMIEHVTISTVHTSDDMIIGVDSNINNDNDNFDGYGNRAVNSVDSNVMKRPRLEANKTESLIIKSRSYR